MHRIEMRRESTRVIHLGLNRVYSGRAKREALRRINKESYLYGK